MAKIKLTKNELKVQRDALKRFERYLPTLQLKKQQLQMEVRQNREAIAAMDAEMEALTERSKQAIALFSGNDNGGLLDIIGVKAWHTTTRNVAGIDVPVFESLELDVQDYDLFTTAPWFEDAVELVREKIELELKKRLLLETSMLLEQELR
ncbi:MAG: hypothetical protein J6W23_04190, partial [Victivallales bacterium]|nr:hypothetical protein [Victivallales bacterium]